MFPAMSRFVVDVTLENVPPDQQARLFEQEREATLRLIAENRLERVLVKADAAGAFVVAAAESADALATTLAELPLHPFMRLRIVPIVAETC